MSRANYGVDSPKVIRNLITFGTALMFIGAILSTGKFPAITMFKYSFFWPAVFLILAAILMILYSKFGKIRHRNRILGLHQWKGSEKVLDVGTGSGLLMIGAAQKLTTGRSYGIDIFNKVDLTNNTIEHTKFNIEAEEVTDKAEIVNGNILKPGFEDQFFDVVISNLCLHNIYDNKEREHACEEINRILKPGGEAIISDFKHTSQYKKVFEKSGMKVVTHGPYYFSTFPPLTIVVAHKP